MAKHTFSTFNYEDSDQKIAQMLFQFKKSKTYAVERMNLQGLNPNSGIGEFYVVTEVNTKFRKKKTDKFQTLEEFWTLNNVFAKSCPHWERTAVTVSVGLGIRGDSIDKDHNPIIQKLVTFQTWFDNKYKSQADGIANRMVGDDYAETAGLVRADWNDNCITNDIIETNALQNGIGILMVLSKHLEQEHSAHTKKVLDIFSKVKI
jgi:hypothetical protein